ncbi:MAG TPA: 3-dehydroquinate synthase [Actinomycetota bacterium]|nr:3-dehydroquinate synthase [Actinomycetota bacterium]
MPAPPSNIVLIGFMASGKTAVGRALAETMGRTHVDVDDIAVGGEGSVGEIFASEGESGFRARERKAVAKAAKRKGVVISAGGGTVLDKRNVRLLKESGVIVYLEASADELARRVAQDGRERPLLQRTKGPMKRRVERLLAERRPVYESVADHVVSSESKEPVEIADEIARLVATPQIPRLRRVKVGVHPPYSVFVGRGLLGRMRELVELPRAAEKICVVSHPKIKRLWGTKLDAAFRGSGLGVTWWTFPEGEDRKTIEMANRLTHALATAGFHRGDVVVALGGGVVGDLAGFAASTYARGIGFVQAPTTLLAMVDAAIGGKTGVNLPEGKNLVGTFHQPLGVVADVDVLGSLPEREFRAGLAEVVKYALIADPGIADIVVRERDEIFARGPGLETLIARCARTKAGVVAADERESGVRAILNYGHTLGHALEALSVAGGRRKRIPKLHHGEAISIGMVYAARISELLDPSRELVAEHRRVLESVGLPTRVKGVDWNDVRVRMTMDKKYARGQRLVVLRGIGAPVVQDVPERILKQAFSEVIS